MEITAQYLRRRAEFYREKAAKAERAARANRYREFAELLKEQADRFEKLTEDDGISTVRPNSNGGWTSASPDFSYRPLI